MKVKTKWCDFIVIIVLQYILQPNFCIGNINHTASGPPVVRQSRIWTLGSKSLTTPVLERGWSYGGEVAVVDEVIIWLHTKSVSSFFMNKSETYSMQGGQHQA